MKVLVTAKRVTDPDAQIRLKADLSNIETEGLEFKINPFDENAVEAAVVLKESGAADEVVVASIGPDESTQYIRTALAMGADRAVILDDDAFQGSDAYGTAKALAAAIEKEEIGIVFAGRQAIDLDNNQVPQIVGGLLGWPHATWINSFEHDGDSATVKRPVGGGSVEVVKVSLPAVFTCSKGLNDPRYASLPGIMKAKRKPVTKYSADDLGVSENVGADNALVSLSDFVPPAARPAGRILQGELSDQVAELVKLLREEAKVL